MKMRKSTHLWREEDHPRDDYGRFCKSNHLGEKIVDNSSKMLNNERKVETFKFDLLSGRINTNIRFQKQNEHIVGTRARAKRVENDQKQNKTPASVFLNTIDVKALISNGIGTGEIVFSRNQKYPREYVNCDIPIGNVWRQGKNAYVQTRRFVRVYSKYGIHAYPVKEKED